MVVLLMLLACADPEAEREPRAVIQRSGVTDCLEPGPYHIRRELDEIVSVWDCGPEACVQVSAMRDDDGVRVHCDDRHTSGERWHEWIAIRVP